MGALNDISLLLCFFSVFIATLFGLFKLLSKALIEFKADFTKAETQSFPDFEELKDSLLDLVHNTIAEMQPPTAFDHLAGIVAQYAQAKIMNMMPIDPSQLLEVASEGLNDS